MDSSQYRYYLQHKVGMLWLAALALGALKAPATNTPTSRQVRCYVTDNLAATPHSHFRHELFILALNLLFRGRPGWRLVKWGISRQGRLPW
jgi:hypothetical protein